VFRKTRQNSGLRTALGAAALGLSMLLGACQSTDLGIDTSANQPPPPAVPTANANGEIIGQGNVRLALLLPRSAPGNAAAVANELRNGAVMAMSDFGGDTVQLVIKDTAGQAASAQAAASEAVKEGSHAILGPVFAANVSAASAITQPSGKVMFAYSTDASVARRGVYLLSYTPQADTRRIINFALSQGKRSFLAFLPENSEGTLREAVLRQEVGSAGANLRVIKYSRSTEAIEQAVISSKDMLPTVDSIYIPEGGQIPNAILQTMRRNDFNAVGKQLIGSGSWESVDLSDPQLEGAIYPGRDISRFEEFAARYETLNGAKPSVWAALGYDSVTLMIDLARRMGPQQAFTPQVIENPRGFTGINGIFRILSDGTSERGLAIYQVRDGKGVQAIPAPTSFARRGGSQG